MRKLRARIGAVLLRRRFGMMNRSVRHSILGRELCGCVQHHRFAYTGRRFRDFFHGSRLGFKATSFVVRSLVVSSLMARSFRARVRRRGGRSSIFPQRLAGKNEGHLGRFRDRLGFNFRFGLGFGIAFLSGFRRTSVRPGVLRLRESFAATAAATPPTAMIAAIPILLRTRAGALTGLGRGSKGWGCACFGFHCRHFAF